MAEIKFRWGLTRSHPEQTPVLIVGPPPQLESLSYQDVRSKIEPCVTEEAWKRGMQCVSTAAGDSVELWPRAVTLASLPARVSRHGAPSRAHSLHKVVKDKQRPGDEFIVLACTKRDVYPNALAIARAYPLFDARTTDNEKARDKTVHVEIVLSKGSGDDPDCCLSDEDLLVIEAAAKAVRLAAKIVDTPCNEMNVDHVIQEAIKVCEDLDLPPPTIIRGEELKARGMGGIYGVGRAAATPPALVVLHYRAGAARTVAWVGKGITYDTGGLCIKSTKGMVGMKRDCGGAAGVLGAFYATVSARPTFNLHAVLCLAENAVGPLATRPDDIHTLYSGKTVEINNTDAEGRLVLSDGVVYAARDLGADIVVDMATLTGAQATATGNYHAAILTNSARLEEQATRAGRSSADLTFPVVFAPEHQLKEYRSKVADMKNSISDSNNAKVSCAGLFVLAHLGLDFPGEWLHIDMAAPAYCEERATGYGVGLLSVLFGRDTRSELLQAIAPRD